jgi:hypothetical protein
LQHEEQAALQWCEKSDAAKMDRKQEQLIRIEISMTANGTKREEFNAMSAKRYRSTTK